MPDPIPPVSGTPTPPTPADAQPVETPVPANIDDRFVLSESSNATLHDAFAGYRWSPGVLKSVIESYGIRDAHGLIAKAIERDGNKYLKRSELEEAAAEMASAALRGYRWSPSVLAKVMTAHDLDQDIALLREALGHDNGNKYLKRSELEGAAKVLAGALQELHIISDLDKTIIRPDGGIYAGAAQLFYELGQLGSDFTYVTARSPERIEGVPELLDNHGLPVAPIETGTSTLPWVAEPEKIADISRTLDADPAAKAFLFGDSSHRDPEVFKAILEAYPDRIIAAFVHKVNNVNPTRVEGMILYDNFAEVAGHLLRMQIFDEPAARRVMDAAQIEGLDITDAQIEALIDEYRP